MEIVVPGNKETNDVGEFTGGQKNVSPGSYAGRMGSGASKLRT